MSDAEYVMTMSSNGQVSIPAATRARWRTRRVLVVDLGDHVVMRPAAPTPEAGVKSLRGKYAGRGPDSAAARKSARRAEDAKSRRQG